MYGEERGGEGGGGMAHAVMLGMTLESGRKHFGKFLVLQAAFQEFLFRQLAVAILVHTSKDAFGAFLGRVRWPTARTVAQHVIDGLNNLCHFLQCSTITTIS